MKWKIAFLIFLIGFISSCSIDWNDKNTLEIENLNNKINKLNNKIKELEEKNKNYIFEKMKLKKKFMIPNIYINLLIQK